MRRGEHYCRSNGRRDKGRRSRFGPPQPPRLGSFSAKPPNAGGSCRSSARWIVGAIIHPVELRFTWPWRELGCRGCKLENTHSDIGFQLPQFPGGRNVENRKVKRSARTVWFNLVFNCTRKRSDTQRGCKSAASLRWEKVLGSIMRTTMEPTNSSRVDHWSRCVQSRYVSSASGTDILTMYCQLR